MTSSSSDGTTFFFKTSWQSGIVLDHYSYCINVSHQLQGRPLSTLDLVIHELITSRLDYCNVYWPLRMIKTLQMAECSSAIFEGCLLEVPIVLLINQLLYTISCCLSPIHNMRGNIGSLGINYYVWSSFFVCKIIWWHMCAWQ